MAPSWKNIASSARQWRSIDRRCESTLILSMLILILRVRFWSRATCRKRRRITWRHPGSTQNWPNRITIWGKFLCAKATFPRQSGNLKKRYVFIPTFRRPRKTCASPRQTTRSFLSNRPRGIDLSLLFLLLDCGASPLSKRRPFSHASMSSAALRVLLRARPNTRDDPENGETQSHYLPFLIRAAAAGESKAKMNTSRPRERCRCRIASATAPGEKRQEAAAVQRLAPNRNRPEIREASWIATVFCRVGTCVGRVFFSNDAHCRGFSPRKIRALSRRNNLSGSPSESSIPPSMTIQKFAALSLLVFGTIAANDVAPSNSELEAMYDRAYRAFDAANYVQALKELDAIDERKQDLAASQNLRGVVYMRQGLYDKAEAALPGARGPA